MERAWATKIDSSTNEAVRQAKQVPVQINYSVGKKRFEKKPDAFDISLVKKIEASEIQHWFPVDRLIEGGETRRNDPIGMTHIHHFYTRRNLAVFAAAFEKLPRFAKWAVTGSLQRGSKQHQIAITRIGGEKAGVGGATAGHRRGTLYIPSNQVEMNAVTLIADRVHSILKAVIASNPLHRGVPEATVSALRNAIRHWTARRRHGIAARLFEQKQHVHALYSANTKYG